MKNKKIFTLIGMILIILSIFIVYNKLGKFGVGSNYWSGFIYSGNIDRVGESIVGEYGEANGRGKFLFSLKKGKYIITKDIDTSKGDIDIKFMDDKAVLISDLKQFENSINLLEDGNYYIEISLKKHSGKFDVSIKNRQ